MGNGLADAAWCAYVGQMANAHELSGILQAFYAFGATISPLIVTALATEGRPGWFAFYYVMTAAAALELVTSAYTFCKHLPLRRSVPPPPGILSHPVGRGPNRCRISGRESQ